MTFYDQVNTVISKVHATARYTLALIVPCAGDAPPMLTWSDAMWKLVFVSVALLAGTADASIGLGNCTHAYSRVVICCFRRCCLDQDMNICKKLGMHLCASPLRIYLADRSWTWCCGNITGGRTACPARDGRCNPAGQALRQTCKA